MLEVTNKISIKGTQKSWKERYIYWSLLLFMNWYIKVPGLCLFIIFQLFSRKNKSKYKRRVGV